MKNEKTVYFLGAGFSKDAGGPIQNEIIKTILSEEFIKNYAYDPNIKKAIKSFKKFLKEDLCLEEELEQNKVQLEDIFTPLDRCILDNKSFKTHSIKGITDLREQFHLLLATSIHYRVDKTQDFNKEYITAFAYFINNIAKDRMNNEFDRIAIITTNWDILAL